MSSDEADAFRRIRSGLNMDAEGASPEEVVSEVRKLYKLVEREPNPHVRWLKAYRTKTLRDSEPRLVIRAENEKDRTWLRRIASLTAVVESEVEQPDGTEYTEVSFVATFERERA